MSILCQPLFPVAHFSYGPTGLPYVYMPNSSWSRECGMLRVVIICGDWSLGVY